MAANVEAYQDQLLTTEQQRVRLNELGIVAEQWGGVVNLLALEDLPVDDRPQQLDSMRVLHVETGSLGETFAAWRNKCLYARYGNAHWNSMLVHADDIDEYTELRPQTRRYDPGIYEVTMDLTQGEQTFREQRVETLADVFTLVEEAGGFLAHSEVLSLVGLHRKTFTKSGGFAREEQPYLPGYSFKDRHFGTEMDRVLQVGTGARDGEMGIRPDRTPKDKVWGVVPVVHDVRPLWFPAG